MKNKHYMDEEAWPCGPRGSFMTIKVKNFDWSQFPLAVPTPASSFVCANSLLWNNNNTYLHKASSWLTKIKLVVAQCRPPYNAKLKLVYIIKYFHLQAANNDLCNGIVHLCTMACPKVPWIVHVPQSGIEFAVFTTNYSLLMQLITLGYRN